MSADGTYSAEPHTTICDFSDALTGRIAVRVRLTTAEALRLREFIVAMVGTERWDEIDKRGQRHPAKTSRTETNR